jgi:hypothetical protein
MPFYGVLQYLTINKNSNRTDVKGESANFLDYSEVSFTRGEERSLEEGFYLADSLMQSIINLEVIAAERGRGGELTPT